MHIFLYKKIRSYILVFINKGAKSYISIFLKKQLDYR